MFRFFRLDRRRLNSHMSWNEMGFTPEFSGHYDAQGVSARGIFGRGGRAKAKRQSLKGLWSVYVVHNWDDRSAYLEPANKVGIPPSRTTLEYWWSVWASASATLRYHVVTSMRELEAKPGKRLACWIFNEQRDSCNIQYCYSHIRPLQLPTTMAMTMTMMVS